MAKGIFYPVMFSSEKGSTVCDEAFQKTSIVQWHQYLRHARNNRKTVSVSCQCQASSGDAPELRLVVSHSDKSDRYWLSAWPFEGSLHMQGCRFYSLWSDKNQSSIYSAGVVNVGTDGMFRIRLRTGLQKKEPKSDIQDEKPVPARQVATGIRKPAMELLGLLHLIWDQAGINVWFPAFEKNRRRDSVWLGHRLHEMARRIRAAKTPIDEVMLIPCKITSAHKARNSQKIRAAVQKKMRMVIVSQLASWTEERELRFDSELPLGLFGGFPILDIAQDVRSRCERSFSRELGQWRKGSLVMVIAQTEPPVTTFRQKDGKAVPSSRSEVIDLALMVVSPRYIPLDSGYEAVIENKLWSEKRAFRKPLRYDGSEDVFPDFLLTDIRGEEFVPLEVFGMKTDEYLARKAVKKAHYENTYGEGRWWSWDAAEKDAERHIPDFPQKNQGADAA